VEAREGGDHIPLIFYASGYTQAEKATYEKDVAVAIDLIRKASPYREYFGHLSIYRAWTPSLKSGIFDTPSDSTFLGMYWSGGVPGWSGDGFLSRMNDTNYQCGGRDQYFVLHNPGVILMNDSVREAGANAGNFRWVAISTRFLPYALIHELGHAMAFLSDEYVLPSGDPFSAFTSSWDEMGGIRHPIVNVWNRLSLDSLPWKAWLSDVPIPTPAQPEYQDSIGLFEGADYYATGRYRPAQQCLMRGTGAGASAYCKVCREAVTARLLNASSIDLPWSPAGAVGMDTVFPVPSVVAWRRETIVSSGQVVVRPIQDSVPSRNLRWRFNGNWLTGIRESLDVASLKGDGLLEAYLETVSPYIRNPELIHRDTLRWTVRRASGNAKKTPHLDGIRRIGPSLFLVRESPSEGFRDALGRRLPTEIVGRVEEGLIVRVRGAVVEAAEP